MLFAIIGNKDMLLLVTILKIFSKMKQVVSKADIIAQLQKEILDLQGLRVPLESEQRDTGLGIINGAFPNQTFPVSAVHEFISASKSEAAATAGFMSGLLGTLMRKGSCLWVCSQQIIFPTALRAFGILPDQVLFVRVKDCKQALWVIEEGLKCESLSAVVGEVPDLSFTESRRLQLAVEKSHVTGFIHRSVRGQAGSVACVSRWRIRPVPTFDSRVPGVGVPMWSVELVKIRNGKPGSWQVAWTDLGFRVAVERAVDVPVAVRKVS